MKEILVTNGNNDHTGTTNATTEHGYIKAAKRIWPYAGLSRVKVRVYENDEPIFEQMIDIN